MGLLDVTQWSFFYHEGNNFTLQLRYTRDYAGQGLAARSPEPNLRFHRPVLTSTIGSMVKSLIVQVYATGIRSKRSSKEPRTAEVGVQQP